MQRLTFSFISNMHSNYWRNKEISLSVKSKQNHGTEAQISLLHSAMRELRRASPDSQTRVMCMFCECATCEGVCEGFCICVHKCIGGEYVSFVCVWSQCQMSEGICVCSLLCVDCVLCACVSGASCDPKLEPGHQHQLTSWAVSAHITQSLSIKPQQLSYSTGSSGHDEDPGKSGYCYV